MSNKVKKAPMACSDNEWIEEEFSGEKQNASQTPSAFQLAPIVQPLAIVPFNTQEQPLFQYGSSYDLNQAREDIAAGFEEDEPVQVYAPIEKRVRFVPIFLAVLSLLIVGVLVLGEFALQQYLVLTPGMSGYAYVMALINKISGTIVIADLVLPGAVAIVAVFSVLNILASLVKMKSRGACAFSKICLFFMLTFSLVLVLICLMNEVEMGYGLYAVAGLSFLSLVIGYLAKKDRK